MGDEYIPHQEVHALIRKTVTCPPTSEYTEVFLLMHSYFIDHYELITEFLLLPQGALEELADEKEKRKKGDKKRKEKEAEVQFKMTTARLSNVIKKFLSFNSWRFICEPEFLEFVTQKIKGLPKTEQVIVKMAETLLHGLSEENKRVKDLFTSDKDPILHFVPPDYVSKYEKLSLVPVQELAEQISLLSHSLYTLIPADEFLHRNYSQASTSRFLWNYKKWIQRLEDMVSVDLAEAQGGKQKSAVVVRYLELLKCLRSLNNFESIFAIFSVLKLSNLRSKLSRDDAKVFDEFTELTNSANNYATYRKALNSAQAGSVLPHLTVSLNSFSECEETILNCKMTIDEIQPHITNYGKLLIAVRSTQEIGYPSIKPNPDICLHLEKLRADTKGRAGDNTSQSSEHYRNMASGLLESFGHSGSPYLRNYASYLKKGGIKCENCAELVEQSKKNVSDLTLLVGQMFELKILQQILKLEDRETVVTVDSNKMKQLSADMKELEDQKKQMIQEIKHTTQPLSQLHSSLPSALDHLISCANALVEAFKSEDVFSDELDGLLDNCLQSIDNLESLLTESNPTPTFSSLSSFSKASPAPISASFQGTSSSSNPNPPNLPPSFPTFSFPPSSPGKESTGASFPLPSSSSPGSSPTSSPYESPCPSPGSSPSSTPPSPLTLTNSAVKE